MDDAEIARILRASQTPLSGAASPGVLKRVSRGTRARAQHRKTPAVRPMAEREDAVRRCLPEAEVKRLLKAIRTSFCNSPHKKWYWTALVDMYAEP
jgi:hypothetical protein